MYSFDIFDTLITRRTAVPKGVFMLMQDFIKGKREYSSFFADNFYELRVGAEALARSYAASQGKQEITLDDIYKALSATACITEKQQEEIKKLEIETECNNVLGITRNIELLKKLAGQGDHIVLISDMYLGENAIRHILEQVDPVFKEIPVYVSSDYGMTKESGELFRVVKMKENVDYSTWVHYGDNKHADIKSASKLGIKAVHLLPPIVKEYEQPQKDLYHQLSVGASKYARELGTESVADEVGCSLGGPILYPYIKWVLDKSMEKGINRLYFVARDGWILQQIADCIIQMAKYPIKTYYIYGSRKAWRLPSYEGSIEDFDEILRWTFMGEVFNFNDLAKAFQLEVEELKNFISDECRESNGEQKLLKVQKDNICRQLRDNKDFRKYLVKRQKEKRELIIRYLKQEMDVSDDKFAFVELSGVGATQKCLANIMGDFYQGKIRNFYFRLDCIQENGQCSFLNFYPSKLKRGHMVELLCRAPHGQTEAYMEKDGYIVPVLEPFEGEQIKAYGLEEYRTAVLAYVEAMEQTYIKNDLPYVAYIGIIREYIGVIAETPPERIAKYFCHMPFSASGMRNAVVEFAPAVTKKQLRKIYFWKNIENVQHVYQGNFLEYALAVSDKAMQYSEKCKKYRKSIIGKWLIGWNRYLHTHQKYDTDFFCPWEFLKGNIVIYGAGKVGQAYVKQAEQRYAKCTGLLWVDKDYARLQTEGLDVKSPEEIRKYSFDRIIIAIHNNLARREIGVALQDMGIDKGKIYYG